MTIQERALKFEHDTGMAVIDLFKLQITPQMIHEFFDYWTEPNKSGTKMKFELEKTWDTKRRLKRWYDNNKKWHGTSPKPGTSEARLDALKRF